MGGRYIALPTADALGVKGAVQAAREGLKAIMIADESRRDKWISAFQALGLVVLFWWLVTGLLFGLPATVEGRRAAAIVASLLGGSALALAILIRQDRSPARGVARLPRRRNALGLGPGGTLWRVAGGTGVERRADSRQPLGRGGRGPA